MSVIDDVSSGAIVGSSPAAEQVRPIKAKQWSARMIADALGLVEVAIVAFTSMLAKHLYLSLFLFDEKQTEPYLYVGITCAVAYHYLARARGLCEPSVLQHGAKKWRLVLSTLAIAFLAIIAIGFIFKVSSTFSRGWLISWFVLAGALLVAGRALSRSLVLWLAGKGEFERRIAVVSAGGSIKKLLESISRDPSTQLAAVFQIDPETILRYADAPSVAVSPLAELVEAGQHERIDELIIRVPRLSTEHLQIIVNEVSVMPVDIWLSTTDDELDLPIYGFGRVGNINLMQVRHRPIGGWGLVAKQVIDYVLAGLSLVLFMPIFLLIGAAIKLDSKGPVLFRQRRHGFNEHEITVLKFRTMTVQEDGAHVSQACKNDPRVTLVGGFLRKTSIDELPQLINVLRGEMSLVGPRPHALVHNDYYRTKVRSYANRHKVKPGITGMAQINGLRGETETPEKMARRVEMDLYYIDNWSIWLDLKILVLTPIYGFVNRNAY